MVIILATVINMAMVTPSAAERKRVQLRAPVPGASDTRNLFGSRDRIFGNGRPPRYQPPDADGSEKSNVRAL